MKILLNSDCYKRSLSGDSKLTVLDGGARGEIFPPFNVVSKDILRVVRVEPDPNASIRTSIDELVINSALWNKNKKISIHIANRASVSSVYPPNIELIELLWSNPEKVQARKTKKIITVDATTIDELVRNKIIPPLDFIKLDIHGSEYECLVGGEETLKNSTIGVLAETWTSPLHINQKLHGEFESLLNRHFFYLFGQKKTGVSKRNISKSKFNRHQIFKYDSVYFKDFHLQNTARNEEEALKAIGIADLFGYYGYALQLNESFYNAQLIDLKTYSFIRRFLLGKNDFFTKYAQKVIDTLSNWITKF